MNEETKKLVEAEGVEAHCFLVDISDREAIYENAKKSIEIYGRVDLLLNNAGIVNSKNFFDCPDELMEKTMKVNTMSLFYVSLLSKVFILLFLVEQSRTSRNDRARQRSRCYCLLNGWQSWS